jgi:hypothetical protein
MLGLWSHCQLPWSALRLAHRAQTALGSRMVMIALPLGSWVGDHVQRCWPLGQRAILCSRSSATLATSPLSSARCCQCRWVVTGSTRSMPC